MNYEEKYNEILEWARKNKARLNGVPIEEVLPELAESEDERDRQHIIRILNDCYAYGKHDLSKTDHENLLAYLERQKENPKSADSIQSDCTSDAKCENRWHKVTDSLPDNGRLVLAKDCLGNVLLARYDGENWEVNVYDNEDHYCHNSISKWCEIPSEKQKEQKPWKVGANAYFTPGQKIMEQWPNISGCKHDCKHCFAKCLYRKEENDEQKPAEWSEEDEHAFGYISEILDACTRPEISLLDPQTVNDFKEWLKSLKPQSHWKPSVEQDAARRK